MSMRYFELLLHTPLHFSNQQKRSPMFILKRNAYTYGGVPFEAEPEILSKIGTYLPQYQVGVFAPKELQNGTLSSNTNISVVIGETSPLFNLADLLNLRNTLISFDGNDTTSTVLFIDQLNATYATDIVNAYTKQIT